MTKPLLLKPASNWLYWTVIALVVKGLFLGWFLTQTYYHDIDGFWGQSNGDMMTYIQPVESLLAHQGFKTDVRMPAYPAVYLLFRLFFSAAVACNLVILLQVVVSALSVYVLGLCAQKLFQTERAFYWAYFIYLFSTFVSVFDGYFLTESLAASASVFFLFAWLRFHEKPTRWFSLLAAGAWLTWSVFLKPAHLPLLAIPIAIWGLRWLRGKLPFKQLLRYSLLFLVPFLLADGAWMVRNYRSYKEVIPLLKSPWYPESFWPANYFDLMAFCQTYGEDFSYWFPNTGIRWIQGWGNNNFLPPVRWYVKEDLGPPPNYVYTARFNRDSITSVRNLCYRLGNGPELDSVQRSIISAQIKEKLNRYTRSVREDNPLVYYVWAPLRYTFTFLHGSWGYTFLDDIVKTQWPRFLLRLYHYIFVLIPGLLGLVLLTQRGLKRDDRLLFIPLAFAYCIVVYVMVLRHPETRYLAPFYPFLVLSAVTLFLSIIRYRQSKKHTHTWPTSPL
ncbi:hypothetical protein [Fibrella aquatica]|uniref:hypothetical protein n=1 Tax=Fibrella aquatica TaxID=3242487 RepID=UPI00352154B1